MKGQQTNMFLEVFSDSFSFIKRHWRNLLIATAATEGIAQLLSFIKVELLSLLTGFLHGPADFILGFAPILPWFVLDSVVVWMVIADGQGKRETLRSAARTIMPRLPIVFTVGFLGILLAGLGFIFIIPGIIAFVYFFLVVPVATIEDNKQIRVILRRSKELVFNSFGLVFGIVFLLSLPGLLLTAVILVLNLRHAQIGLPLKVTQILANTLLGGMLLSVVRAVIYTRLSSARNS